MGAKISTKRSSKQTASKSPSMKIIRGKEILNLETMTFQDVETIATQTPCWDTQYQSTEIMKPNIRNSGMATSSKQTSADVPSQQGEESTKLSRATVVSYLKDLYARYRPEGKLLWAKIVVGLATFTTMWLKIGVVKRACNTPYLLLTKVFTKKYFTLFGMQVRSHLPKWQHYVCKTLGGSMALLLGASLTALFWSL